MVYYTFDEWLEFIKAENEEMEHADCEALTQKIWDSAVEQEAEDRQYQTSLRRDLARDVAALEIVALSDLVKTYTPSMQIVLEPKLSGISASLSGNSLRILEDGIVDFLGGAGKYAVLNLELVQKDPVMQVRFRSVFSGAYLLFANSTLTSTEDSSDSRTIFELLERGDNLVVLCCKREPLSAGTFFIRSVSQEQVQEETSTNADDLSSGSLELEALAKSVMEDNPEFAGTRSCAMDWSGAYHAFPEFVKYVSNENGLDCSESALIISRAKALWAASYVDTETLERRVKEAVAENSSLSDERIWVLDQSRKKYSYLGMVLYFHQKGWGGVSLEGTLEAAKAAWDNSYVPGDDDWELVDTPKGTLRHAERN